MNLRRPHRSKLVRLLAALAATVLALCLALPGTSTAERQATVNVRALSYNMHHGAAIDGASSMPLIAKEINDSGADVVGLQEVDKHWGERSDWHDQATLLADRLGMYVAFGANLDLDPEPGDAERRQFGTAVLSRYPIVSATNHLLTNIEYPEKPTEQRGLLHAVIDVDGAHLDFYNTHLDHQRAEQRISQVEEILDIVEDNPGTGILVGDLNAEPEVEEVRMLTDGPFEDAFEGSDGDFTFPADEPIKRIDYLLATEAESISDAEVMASEASDHLPLIATVTMTSPER